MEEYWNQKRSTDSGNWPLNTAFVMVSAGNQPSSHPLQSLPLPFQFDPSMVELLLHKFIWPGIFNSIMPYMYYKHTHTSVCTHYHPWLQVFDHFAQYRAQNHWRQWLLCPYWWPWSPFGKKVLLESYFLLPNSHTATRILCYYPKLTCLAGHVWMLWAQIAHPRCLPDTFTVPDSIWRCWKSSYTIKGGSFHIRLVKKIVNRFLYHWWLEYPNDKLIISISPKKLCPIENCYSVTRARMVFRGGLSNKSWSCWTAAITWAIDYTGLNLMSHNLSIDSHSPCLKVC